MLESVEALLAEHAELEALLADPAVIGDPDRLREVNRRYAELTPVVTAQRELDLAVGDLEAARELAAADHADHGSGGGEAPGVGCGIGALAAVVVHHIPRVVEGRVRSPSGSQ